MTRELAGTMAKKLVENSNTAHSVPVLAYGIELLVNGFIKIIALTLLGLAMGMVKEIYVMAFIFGTFRTITGGVHAQTFGRCFTISLGSFAILTFLIPFTNEWFLTHAGMIFFLSTILGFILIFQFVPGVWKGRIYNDERVRNSKWLSHKLVYHKHNRLLPFAKLKNIKRQIFSMRF